MRKILLIASASLMLLSSCTSNMMEGAALGSMFGSSIGAITGGHRGYHTGGLIGAVAGAALGAAVDESERPSHNDAVRVQSYADDRDAEVQYRDYAEDHPYAPVSPWESLSIENVTFSDANGNRYLNAGERGYISFDIRNNGHRDINNVMPIVSSNNNRVTLSTPAIIQTIPAGQGVRYKVSVSAKRSLREGVTNFKIYFSNAYGRNAVIMKTFNIRTRK